MGGNIEGASRERKSRLWKPQDRLPGFPPLADPQLSQSVPPVKRSEPGRRGKDVVTGMSVFYSYVNHSQLDRRWRGRLLVVFLPSPDLGWPHGCRLDYRGTSFRQVSPANAIDRVVSLCRSHYGIEIGLRKGRPWFSFRRRHEDKFLQSARVKERTWISATLFV